jgi:hypothetical protein
MAKSNPPPPPPGSPPEQDLDQDAEDRDAILKRRAIFITSALAGLSLAVSCEPRPQPCLEPPLSPHLQESAPQPCLSVPIQRPDAGAMIEDAGAADAGDAGRGSDAGPGDGGITRDAGSSDAGSPDGGPRPQPCLRVKPPPPPTPCLKMLPPRDR